MKRENINYTVEHPIFQYDLRLLKQIGIDINTSFENSGIKISSDS